MLNKTDSAVCNACGENVVTDHKRGRVICTNCGLIKEDRFIDLSSEYRYFIENTSIRGDPRRVGNAVNTHLDSQIDLIEIDNGKRSYHTFSAQSNLDKTYTRAIKLIKRYCDLLDISNNIVRQVEEIFYEVQDKKELHGKRLEIIVASCIYLACKRNLVNIQPTALEPVCDASQGKILKTTKIILKYIPTITIHASEYIKLFCSKLQVGKEHTQEMVAICKEIENWDFFESKLPKPRTIAAAVIFFYLSLLEPKHRKKLQDIKDVAGICTDNTIKKYYNSLFEKINFLRKKLNLSIEEVPEDVNGPIRMQ